MIGVALSIAESIVSALKSNVPIEKSMICGSLRRMKDTIGDIDILVISKEPNKVMDFFVGLPNVKEVLARVIQNHLLLQKKAFRLI